MEKETSISEKMQSSHSEPQNSNSEALSSHFELLPPFHYEQNAKNLVSEFNKIADFIREKYGASIWFVEILGKRHSYIAGHKEDSFLPPEVIYLTERYAIVSNEWEKISEKDQLVSSLKTLLSKETSS